MDTEEEDDDQEQTATVKEPAENEATVPIDIPSDEEGQEERETEMEVQAAQVPVVQQEEQKEEAATKIEIPSVVTNSGDDSEDVLLEAPMAAAMGDLRQQLDQLRVSEALEAVSQSLKDQPFMMQTEFCGQQIMDWFGNVSQKE